MTKPTSPTRRSVALDEVKTGLILHPWPGLETSAQDRWEGRKKHYKAYYRMNTGYWRMEADIYAFNDAHAVELANKFIPARKPRDVTYMVLHALYALEE